MISKIITGKLRTLTAIHIGSSETDITTDSPFFRDAAERVIIPGTSLAGNLRTLTTKIAPHLGFDPCVAFDNETPNAFCDCIVCSLFGSLNPEEIKDSNETQPKINKKGHASKIWVNNALLEGEIKSEIRDGVGIDRETKTSANKMRAKFDYEIVSKDTVFRFQIELEDNVSQEEEQLLAAVLAEWSAGRCYLGGKIARGLGNCVLESLTVYKLDLSKTKNLMKYLKSNDPLVACQIEENWLEKCLKAVKEKLTPIKEETNTATFYNSFLEISLTLFFPNGIIVNDLKASLLNFDFLHTYEQNSFILLGSSIRGSLRSHAERILRTIKTLESQTKETFLNVCPACNPFAKKDDALTACYILLKKHRQENQILPHVNPDEGAFCLACRFFGNPYIGSRLLISDGHLISDPKIKILDFLAIDRFTGGGKAGAKFDAVVLWQPTFKVKFFLENPKKWEIAWLLLTLRDLDQRLYSIGLMSNKNFGEVKIEKLVIKEGVIKNKFLFSANIKTKQEGIFEVKEYTIDDLLNSNELDNVWLEEFHNELKKFNRLSYMVPEQDSYFQKEITKLYPLNYKENSQ